MKPGDLVRLRREKKLYTISEWSSVGVIVQALTGGSHRKHAAYLVMWPDALEGSSNIPHKQNWHAAPSLEKVD